MWFASKGVSLAKQYLKERENLDMQNIKLKGKLFAILLAFVMIFTGLGIGSWGIENAYAASSSVKWSGAYNQNEITASTLPQTAETADITWKTKIGQVNNWGQAYAGTNIIIGDYLYTTGQEKLMQINKTTGIVEKCVNGGSTAMYYDYLTYGNDTILVATQTSLTAYGLNDLSKKWEITDCKFGFYHPLQYNEGYLFCSGYIYKIAEDGMSATQIGTGTVNNDIFSWTAGCFVGEYYYIASQNKLYVVDYKNSTDNIVIKDQKQYSEDTTAAANKPTATGLVYDNGTLYWVSHTGTWSSTASSGIVYKNTVNPTLGSLNDDLQSSSISQMSCAKPVVYNGRIYVGGQKGNIDVINAATLNTIYTISTGGGKIQGNPLISSAGNVGEALLYVQAYNGSIYILKDSEGITNGNDATLIEIAKTVNPEKGISAYSFEQLSVDQEGGLYAYCESGYLYKISLNEAYLKKLNADKGTFTEAFNIYSTDYEVVVPRDTEKITFEYADQSNEEKTKEVSINGEQTNATITATKGVNTRKYNIQIRKVSNVATLKKVGINGSASVNATYPLTYLTPKDDLYKVEGWTGGNGSAKISRIYLSLNDSKATTTWETIQGVSKSIANSTASDSEASYHRVINYFSGVTNPVLAKLTITAEDGVTKKEYYFVVTSGDDSSYKFATNITMNETTLSLAKANKEAQLSVNVSKSVGTATSYSDSIKWTSSNPDVATVDPTGKVTAVTTGKVKITAEYGITKAICDVTVTGMPATVYVTIGDKGELATAKDGTSVAQKEVSVNDEDNDGALTVNDALIATHNNLYQGGSSAGYAAANTEYGLSITKLWGDTSGNYGYWINNNSCWSLTDPINAGDYLTAFVYKDSGYSDTYAKFENQTYNTTAGQNVVLQVSGYSWQTYGFTPYQEATVKVLGANNGSYNTLTTNASGQVTLKFPSAGTYYVEAYEANASKYMVPCVCKVVVTPATPITPQEGTVTFTMKGDTVHTGTLHQGTSYPTWIAPTTVTLSDSIKTVGNVFKKVLDEKGFNYVGLSGNYVSSITNANGVTLAEFTNGNNSGWKYRVNGDEPQKGLNDYTLSAGDTIEFFYTDDYTKDPGADKWLPVEEEKTVSTNAPATVKDNTASATITASDVNKLITDAGTKKAAEITLNVTNAGTAKDVVIELPKASLTDVVSKTDANLVVATPQGNVTLDQKTMGEIASQAKGNSIIIEIKKVENTDDTLKDKIGENASVIDVTVKSGDTIIKSFNGNKITLTIELGNDLKDKTLTGIRINENGKLEKLGGKKITKDGKTYFAFETAQLSQYAVAEESVVDATITAQEKAEKIKAGVKATTIKTLKAKATKSKVVLTFAKSKGYKVDGYYIYKSTKKTTGFKYIGKTAKNKFTNKKSLVKGKTYYYKVKGYRLVDGVKVFTKTKTIKVVAK